MRLTSPAFGSGDPIPARYSEKGLNVLPPLAIEGVPAGAASLAVVIEDPDSPLGRGVTHWLAWNIPPGTRHLDAAAPPEGTLVGTDTFGKVGYTGPNPPEGRHHYHFRLLALDEELALPSGATRAAFDRAIRGHVLAEAGLTGIFERYMDEEDGG
ncbi:YbhB/YbcL family Raf kinase inhibitor-like protein [Thiohalorhabdus sp.]|uniref:YbhB/YbcL family Raf kinase inhibitor-like protein n=1 Tax=Thiohalorhabdus sp. TaxID=3094134 RepID=UPI002FC2AF22